MHVLSCITSSETMLLLTRMHLPDLCADEHQGASRTLICAPTKTPCCGIRGLTAEFSTCPIRSLIVFLESLPSAASRGIKTLSLSPTHFLFITMHSDVHPPISNWPFWQSDEHAYLVSAVSDDLSVGRSLVSQDRKTRLTVT